MELSQLAFTIQAFAVPLAALVLWIHARAVPAPYLAYWTAAWASLSLGLVSLRVWMWLGADFPLAPPLLTAYFCLSYLFGFLLWAGCRNLTRGLRLGRGDLWLLAPALVFGLAAPWVFSGVHSAAPIHTPLFGGYFLLALSATRLPTRSADPRPGVAVVRICLITLGVLFIHYGPVTYWCVYELGDPYAFRYMVLSPMYNALAEVGLAFGMTMITTEGLRDRLAATNRELADANRRLAEASDELASAARTDALTGLLNRRALEQARPAAGAVAVIDLNDLKRVNDSWGHEAGDAAIRHVARALAAYFRITDSIYRTGGDEFVVVSEGSHLAEMAERLGEVDAALKGQRLPGLESPHDLTVAWGASEFADPSGLEASLRLADASMYRLKAERKAGAA